VTTAPKHRSHLVERAVEALGGPGVVGRLAQADASVSTSPPPPPPAPVAALVAAQVSAAPPPAPPGVPPAASHAADRQPAAAPPAIDLDALRRAGQLVGAAGGSRTRLAEEISIVQHQLVRTLRALPAERGRIARAVLVTSARPGEGKTFNSLNIAASIAAGGGAPVLLVDADGKREGSLTELLGAEQAQGLRLLAARPTQQPGPLLLATAQPGLSFLSYGPSVPGEAAVPPAAQVAAALLRVAAAKPDHVLVLDSPPCLSTSDPSSLAAVVGQVVVVVEAERTQRGEVEAALDMVDACPNLQLLLNRTRLTDSDTFGAYGGYGAYGPYGPHAAQAGS
jgi:receptor protein-tyrosine kinase